MYEDIRVKNVFDDIYSNYGRKNSERGSHNDPNSLSSLELSARRRAFNNLSVKDRSVILKSVESMNAKTGIKQDSLLNILMHIGIFLNACDRRRQ